MIKIKVETYSINSLFKIYTDNHDVITMTKDQFLRIMEEHSPGNINNIKRWCYELKNRSRLYFTLSASPWGKITIKSLD